MSEKEYKRKAELMFERNTILLNQLAILINQLEQAKEIIKLGLRAVNTSSAKYMSEYEHKAEDFLKE